MLNRVVTHRGLVAGGIDRADIDRGAVRRVHIDNQDIVYPKGNILVARPHDAPGVGYCKRFRFLRPVPGKGLDGVPGGRGCSRSRGIAGGGCTPCWRLCRGWRYARCPLTGGENAHAAKYDKRKDTEHNPQPGTTLTWWWPWRIQGLPRIGRIGLWCVGWVVGSRIVLHDLLLRAI